MCACNYQVPANISVPAIFSVALGMQWSDAIWRDAFSHLGHMGDDRLPKLFLFGELQYFKGRGKVA